jgi:hypothetical protein
MCCVVVKEDLLEGRDCGTGALEAYPLTNIPIPTSYPQLWKPIGDYLPGKARTLGCKAGKHPELHRRKLLTVCIRVLKGPPATAFSALGAKVSKALSTNLRKMLSLST